MNDKLMRTIFKAVALGTGIATLVLSILGSINTNTAITLLSIGLVCLAIVNLQED